jgi:hypothetical protein
MMSVTYVHVRVEVTVIEEWSESERWFSTSPTMIVLAYRRLGGE